MKIVLEGKNLEKLNEVIGDLRHRTVQEIQPLITLLNESVVQDPADPVADDKLPESKEAIQDPA